MKSLRKFTLLGLLLAIAAMLSLTAGCEDMLETASSVYSAYEAAGAAPTELVDLSAPTTTTTESTAAPTEAVTTTTAASTTTTIAATTQTTTTTKATTTTTKATTTTTKATTTTTKPAAIDENGSYTQKDDVALYIHTYNHLPSNYIKKSEARALGWEGGSLERYAPGCSIGGDTFRNLEGLLPSAKGRKYTECDIDAQGRSSRGAKRIVFSNDGLIYYTDDHYGSFELLYGGD